MEKDFNKEVSNSDNAPSENKEDTISLLLDEEMLYRAQQESLQEHLAKLVEEKDKKEKYLASLKASVFSNNSPQFETSPFLCTGSPAGSPIQESQTLSEEAIANPPESTILMGKSRQPDVVSSDRIKILAKNSENISNTLQSLHERMDSLKKFLTSQNETQASGVCSELDSQSDLEIKDKNAGSNVNYAGKGKEAVNPKYRYTKGSKKVPSCDSSGKEADKLTHKYKKKSETDVSSYSSLAKDTPSKRSEEASSKSESKSPRHDSQESKAQVESIFPAMKRKGSDPNVKDHYGQNLDESSPTTSGLSLFTGNLSDDEEDLKTAKKLKFEGSGNKNKNDPSLRGLLSNPVPESLDLQQFMTSEQRERFNSPSAIGYTSTGEDSTPRNGSDIEVLSERGDSPLASVSDMSSGEKEDSCLTNVNENESSLCGRYFLQLLEARKKQSEAKDKTKSDEASP